MAVTEWESSPVTTTSAAGNVIATARFVVTWSAHTIIEQREAYVTVVDTETGIFGSGADYAAALEDFERALREHFDVLNRQDALSPELEAQLRYLRDRLA